MTLFDGVSRSELERQLIAYAKEVEALRLSLFCALRDNVTMFETLTAAQERGSALQLELQALKASPCLPWNPLPNPHK